MISQKIFPDFWNSVTISLTFRGLFQIGLSRFSRSVATLETFKQYFCLANRHKNISYQVRKISIFRLSAVLDLSFFLATKLHKVAILQIVILYITSIPLLWKCKILASCTIGKIFMTRRYQFLPFLFVSQS